MRIKTGETATAEVSVDLLYTCSRCKSQNLSTGIIRSKVHTPTIMGVNLGGDMRIAAQEELHATINEVLDPKKPHRFRSAQFNCRCNQCGHKEPWARMNYDHLDILKTSSIWVLIISAICIFAGLPGSSSGFNIFYIMLTVALILSISTLVGLLLYIEKNNDTQEHLISALPQESLPIILPYSMERHRAFQNIATSRWNE